MVVNGRYEGGGGRGLYGDIGEGFCPSFIQTCLENVDRKSRYDGSRKLIPGLLGGVLICIGTMVYKSLEHCKYLRLCYNQLSQIRADSYTGFYKA